MKLKQWLYGATALAMLAACSDKDVAPGGGEVNGNDQNETVAGYIALQINLPTEAVSSRAGEAWSEDDADINHPGLNDYYKDGEKNEYAVENMLIVLFKGSASGGEKAAKYYKHRAISKPFFSNSPENDGTSTSSIIAIPVETAPGDNVYALVVLNRDNQYNFKVDEDNKLYVAGTLIQAEEALEEGGTIPGTTFGEILKKTVDQPFIFRNGDNEMRFFMTNAPLSEEPGGNGGTPSEKGKISYLVSLNGNVYPTETEAKEKVAGCIYVERAVAKVTYLNGRFDNNAIKLKKDVNIPEGETNVNQYKYTGFSFAGEKIGEEKGYDDIKISATVKYALTNTNNISYIIRNVDFTKTVTGTEGSVSNEPLGHFSWDLKSNITGASGGYRMIGERPMPKLNDPFHTSDQQLYRTYWCHDPNYDVEMQKSTVIDQTKQNAFNSLSTPIYCKENTFTVKHQNHGNSTLAIFEVDYNITYKDKEGEEQTVKDLYTRNNDNSTLYLTIADAMSEEVTRIAKDPDIRRAMKIAVKNSVDKKDEIDADNPAYSVTDHLDLTIVPKDIVEKKTVDGKEVPVVVGKELQISNISLKLLKDDQYFDEHSKTVFEHIIGTSDGKYEGDKKDGYPAYNEDGTLKTKLEGETEVQVYDWPQIKSDLLTRVNLLNTVNVYADGKSYYVIPIKHFGDYYTPWKETEGITTDKVYNWSDGVHAANYLGRYGMVRNNWYELNITELRALGSGVIPPIDDTLSDDNKEIKKYIAIEIHTLSWAKRYQGVQF